MTPSDDAQKVRRILLVEDEYFIGDDLGRSFSSQTQAWTTSIRNESGPAPDDRRHPEVVGR